MSDRNIVAPSEDWLAFYASPGRKDPARIPAEDGGTYVVKVRKEDGK